MRLRMTEDSILSTDCYGEVCKIVARGLDGLSVEDLLNELNETQPLGDEDDKGCDTQTQLVEAEPLDEHVGPDVQCPDLGLPEGGHRGTPVHEAPDAHVNVAEVAQSEEAPDGMAEEIPLVSYEVY